MIQVISEIGQAKSFVQEDNHLDYLIQVKRLTHVKRLGRVVSAQAKTIEISQICVSQQYRWHMMIEAEWGDLRQTNSPRDIFLAVLVTFSCICMKLASFVMRVS